MKNFMDKDNEIFGNTQGAGAGGKVAESGYMNLPAAGSPVVKRVVSPSDETEDVEGSTDMNDFEDSDSEFDEP
jgi:hypothetical protein